MKQSELLLLTSKITSKCIHKLGLFKRAVIQKQETCSTPGRSRLRHYTSTVLSNLKASQIGEKLFILLKQSENLSYISIFWCTETWAVPYLPSKSKSFIRVDGGSDRFYALKEERSFRSSFYLVDVWHANISIVKKKSQKTKKKPNPKNNQTTKRQTKSCSLFVSFQKINRGIWSCERIGTCKRVFQYLNTWTPRGLFSITGCRLLICFPSLLFAVKIFL